MRLAFVKMHGAGNDFVLFDDRRGIVPWRNAGWMSALARRRTGIGAEGIILIQPSGKADFRMRFLNPDGQTAEMCGNGARCAARLAHRLGAAPRRMRIETDAGQIDAALDAECVQVTIAGIGDRRFGLEFPVRDRMLTGHFVVAGVPHLVVPLDSVDELDVASIGALLRRHDTFAPAGTNVDFVSRSPDSGEWVVRTYERGVEAETGACGTGALAAAVVITEVLGASYPLAFRTTAHYRLEVSRSHGDGELPQRLVLTGPAEYVYHGELTCAAAALDLPVPP